MRISDWSSDVCSSDLLDPAFQACFGRPLSALIKDPPAVGDTARDGFRIGVGVALARLLKAWGVAFATCSGNGLAVTVAALAAGRTGFAEALDTVQASGPRPCLGPGGSVGVAFGVGVGVAVAGLLQAWGVEFATCSGPGLGATVAAGAAGRIGIAEALDTVPASGPLPDPGRDGSVVVAFGAGVEGQAGIAGGEAWTAVLGILGALFAAGVP